MLSVLYLLHTTCNISVYLLSCMMLSLNRWMVADFTPTFDSETMVFVSPPPVEKSKAVAPIMPFNIYVGINRESSLKSG